MEYKNLNEIMSCIETYELSLLIGSTKDCGVCVAIKPRIQELLKKYNKVQGIYVSIDSLQEASGEFMIFTVPTIILFARSKEVHRESRFINFRRLEFELSHWSEYMGFSMGQL